MKITTLSLLIASIFSIPAISATQISNKDESNYIPIGNIVVTENGFDGSAENISKKADVLCREISDIGPDDCFFKYVAGIGNSDFNSTNIEIFKRK
ncbi:hypothetical protein PS037_23610 (plasmid) [Escherichia albertii]|uniref:hypothetical protein n=1 Tax=Escherichia albertii TaxID=208962 RepID=UPI00235F0934|nr:hypothetical protein [Escherichia albertii]WDB54706.1 hypothetical protein PS037_23610 [Escherichia albertii]